MICPFNNRKYDESGNFPQCSENCALWRPGSAMCAFLVIANEEIKRNTLVAQSVAQSKEQLDMIKEARKPTEVGVVFKQVREED